MRSPNGSVKALKTPVWCRLQTLLGQSGDRIVMDLLLDCAIFRPIPGDLGNYYQLSGVPISELKPDQQCKSDLKDNDGVPVGDCKTVKLSSALKSPSAMKSPSAITFVRSRMLYAKAALNAKGGVRFGMRHIRQS
jgi:hypothetical protein